MKSQNSTEAGPEHGEWTPERITLAKSAYYPLCDSGPLCPLLDDEELLFDFYVKGNLRQQIKRFCKKNTWDGKPPVPRSMTDQALKVLLRSMCNSPESRRMLKASSETIELHDAIWAWLRIANNSVFEVAISYCYRGKSGKYFMEPSSLGRLLASVDHDRSQANNSLIYLALGFAMLEGESSVELIAEVVTRYPEIIPQLGLSCNIIPRPNGFSEPIAETQSEALSPSRSTVPTGGVGADISQRTLVPSVDCLVPHIDHLVREAAELKELSGNFSENAQQLAAVQELAAFADSGDVAPLISLLELKRKHIQDRIFTLQTLLASRCSNADKEECELKKLLRQYQDNPATTPGELLGNVGELRKVADSLVRQAEVARAEIRELRSSEADLRTLVGLSSQEPHQLEHDVAPCKILDEVTDQQRTVADLKMKLSVEVTKRKDALAAECDQLEAKYGFSTDTSSRETLATLGGLRLSIASAEGIQEVNTCKRLLEKIAATASEIQNCNPRALANRLAKEPDEFPVFLDLCRTLMAQSAPEISFFLLHMRQRLHPYEEVSECTDQAFSILLEAACQSASGELPLQTVWGALCAEPWLLSLGRDHIQSSDLHERLVIALLGAALGGDTGRAASILVNIGAAELGRQAVPGVLYELLQAVVSRRPLHFASAQELETRRAQEFNISERIAFDGSKYRHLQCKTATHFARFEVVQVFPALVDLWSMTSENLSCGNYGAAHSRVDNIDIGTWYDELVRKHNKPVIEHLHFSEKIRAFMRDFLSRIREYLVFYEDVWGGDRLVLAEDELSEALQQWAGVQKERCAVIALVMQIRKLPHATSAPVPTLLNAFAQCESVILRCPRFIPWLRAQQNPDLDLKTEQLILEDLGRESQLEDAARILGADSAWKQLSILYQTADTARAQNGIAKHNRDVAGLADRRNEVLATNDESLIELFDTCVQGDRFPAAHQVLEKCNRRNAQMRAREQETVASFVDNQIEKVDSIKEVAVDANMPETWQESVARLAARIEWDLRTLRRSDGATEASQAAQERLGRAVDALNFVVQQHTLGFDEVEHYLTLSRPEDALPTVSVSNRARALDKYPELHKTWALLASPGLSDEGEGKRAWTKFVREFAKACNLYHDEHDEEKRFVTVPSIKYPFLVHQTGFYKPQSEFLKRPLRLYLFREGDVDFPALQRLEAELSGDNSAAWLHVVFAPKGLERIRRYFKYDIGFKNFLLVDAPFLDRLGIADKPDVPLRQALHASVTDLASSSPFVAQGYCHQHNNIYVGRTDILQKLLNTPQAMIWGGRRIGKTSVLHTLKRTLARRNYSVAYVYVDLEDQGDPDLAIAKKIAATLKLQSIDNITDFERQIASLRTGGSRFAFLIDEVDEYIKKSRTVHGDAFPLATALRQLVMADSEKDTILVYSGYHQLYYEAKLYKGKRRVGHPFINIAQDIPIRDLSYDDVNELVRTGFEEMLGISVSPGVPRQIAERASRHPAFVQQFCRCLLEHVSTRRSPNTRVTIMADDVEAVYASNCSSEGGEQCFILYVNETLGYNLSHLGRAMMLTICEISSSPVETEDSARCFSISKIREDLDIYCDLCEVAPTQPEHFRQTLELLVMTNMLTQHSQEHDQYRITYPTYIDILRRLDKLGRAAIQHSLQEYDKLERAAGVLL